ncbi:hypothetical protein V8C26DRAFT_306177 [Trichoderma gracile]
MSLCRSPPNKRSSLFRFSPPRCFALFFLLSSWSVRATINPVTQPARTDEKRGERDSTISKRFERNSRNQLFPSLPLVFESLLDETSGFQFALFLPTHRTIQTVISLGDKYEEGKKKGSA